MDVANTPKIEVEDTHFFMHLKGLVGSSLVSITETKGLDKPNEDGIRLYRDSPCSANLQIRAHCGIGEFGDGVKRDMNATASLGVAEMRALRDHLDLIINDLEGKR